MLHRIYRTVPGHSGSPGIRTDSHGAAERLRGAHPALETEAGYDIAKYPAEAHNVIKLVCHCDLAIFSKNIWELLNSASEKKCHKKGVKSG